MQDVAIFVQHIEFQLLIRSGNNGKSRFRTAKHRTLHGRYLPAERSRGVDHIIYRTAGRFDVLEIVDIATYVKIYSVFAQQGVYPLLHILTLYLVFGCLGIDRMVAYNHFPGLVGGLQRRVNLANLPLHVLFGHIPVRLFVLLMVFVNQGGCFG